MLEKPKNLQECFERLKKGCELLVTDEYGYTDDYGIFNLPATEEQIKRFESGLKFPLPQAYREFLKFSNGAWILGHEIYGLDKFALSDQYVPDGYLAISRTEMTSERLAISEEDGKVYLFWELKGDHWEFEKYLLSQLELCEEKIDEYNREKEREERRKAGMTEEQERAELHARIMAERKRIEEKKLRGEY